MDKHHAGMAEKWWLKPLAEPVLHMPVPSSYNDVTQGVTRLSTSLTSSQVLWSYLEEELLEGESVSLTSAHAGAWRVCVYADDELRRHIGWVWYERDFYAPKNWLIGNQRIVLRFESVSYHAMAWVDGIHVGLSLLSRNLMK